MDDILLQQNPHWSGQTYDGLETRDCFADLMRQLQISEIMVLQGIRRCGKSTLFYFMINALMQRTDPKKILYVNLDDPYFTGIADDPKQLYTITQTAEKIVDKKIEYLFLDEIQNVEGWEKFVKSIYDSQVYKKIFVTGSNAELLSSKYATLLTGRYIREWIYPYTFNELLSHQNISDKIQLIKQKATALRITDNMMQFGSFPKVYYTEDTKLKRSLLVSYYEAILQKDCIKNNNIRDIKTFMALAYYMITHAGSVFSYKSLSKVMGCTDVTIKDFIQILEGSYMFEELRTYSLSLKKQLANKKKGYFIDNGLINAIAFKFFDAKGKLFENLVYTELKKALHKDVYFYNDSNECDFLVKTNESMMAIQVCYTLTQENKTRETNGLSTVIENLHCKQGIIITYNQEEDIAENMHAIPFWKFFFKPNLDLFLQQ